MSDDGWYWCFDHQEVERGTGGCRADRRLGPYESAEAARNWRARSERREERWEAEDRRWKGTPRD